MESLQYSRSCLARPLRTVYSAQLWQALILWVNRARVNTTLQNMFSRRGKLPKQPSGTLDSTPVAGSVILSAYFYHAVWITLCWNTLRHVLCSTYWLHGSTHLTSAPPSLGLHQTMATLSAASGLRLLETGQHSDFTIECRGRVWKVHKIVLGSISAHLDRVCNGDLRVSRPRLRDHRSSVTILTFADRQEESSEARLVLDEEDPVILDIVVKWLYTTTYISLNTGDENDAGRAPDHQQRQEHVQLLKINHLQTLVKVYCCADRFLLDDIKHVCMTEMNDALPLLLLYTGGLVHAVLQQVFENTTTTDPLRSTVLEYCVRLHPKIQNHPLIVAVLKRFGPQCWELRMKFIQDYNDIYKQNNANLTEVTRLTKANDALRMAQATLVQKASEAEAKCYHIMWRLRNFLRDETVCSKCVLEVTKNQILIRLLHIQYAIKCPDCQNRVWWTSR